MIKEKVTPRGGVLLPTITMDQARDIQDQALKAWERRRLAQGWKKRLKSTKALQAEFLMGVCVTTDVLYGSDTESTISPKILFGIMRGDYIE